jgi:hypothetical protein
MGDGETPAGKDKKGDRRKKESEKEIIYIIAHFAKK